MKTTTTLVLLALFTLTASAQESAPADDALEFAEAVKLIDRFSFVGSLGSPSVDLNTSEYKPENVSNSFTLGELGAAYKLSDKVRIGVSALGTLGNCNCGYFDQEGNFIAVYTDDEGEEDEEEDEEEGPECEADDFDNLAATLTLNLFENVPVFVQATAGYSFVADAPAISAMVGYSQSILDELGVYLGVRFSDVFHDIPSDAVSVTSSSGLKVEFGVNWNF